MVGANANPGALPKQIPPSDPAALAEAASRWGLGLEWKRFNLEASGRIGPASWAELVERTSSAFATCGLTTVEAIRPRYEGDPLFNSITELGFGYIVGESALRVNSRGILGVDYSSFIVTGHFWVEPALPKHSTDRPDVPHTWVARVGAGQVVSSNTVGKHGPYRTFSKLGELEPGFEWVPRTLLAKIQGGVT